MKTRNVGKAYGCNQDRLHSEFRFQLRRGDRIVRRLDDFPELAKALREGDVPAGRALCARLFDFRARQTWP